MPFPNTSFRAVTAAPHSCPARHPGPVAPFLCPSQAPAWHWACAFQACNSPDQWVWWFKSQDRLMRKTLSWSGALAPGPFCCTWFLPSFPQPRLSLSPGTGRSAPWHLDVELGQRLQLWVRLPLWVSLEPFRARPQPLTHTGTAHTDSQTPAAPDPGPAARVRKL